MRRFQRLWRRVSVSNSVGSGLSRSGSAPRELAATRVQAKRYMWRRSSAPTSGAARSYADGSMPRRWLGPLITNHKAAVSLFISHYNLCRVHETIRMTPAMALGVADHIWTIGELVEAATNPETVSPRQVPFTVIDGGLA